MKSLVFFGSLKSKKLLQAVIGINLEHLKFFNAKIYNSKLYKVKNENFPYLEKTNSNYDIVECTYIEGLFDQDFEKILFYESIEYKISEIEILLDKKKIKSNFFELIKKNKTSELWFYDKWKVLFEELSCIAAKKWMLLFDRYKNNPEKAEVYWQKMLEKAKKEIHRK